MSDVSTILAGSLFQRDPPRASDPGRRPTRNLYRKRRRSYHKKYSPLGELGTFAQQYVDSISQILGCPVCVADRDQIIAVAGMPKKDLVGKAIHKDLEEVINDRENIIARHGDTRYVNITSDDTAYAGQVIQTIICEGDAIGAVIVLSKDDKMRFGETEQKTAIIAANFLGKQMEN